MLKKLFCILPLLALVSCYDYDFKEVQVSGQVYLVKAEGFPDHYTLEFKESDTHYRPLVTDRLLVLYDAGNKLYVGTREIPPKCYKINPATPDGVQQISEEEFVTFIKGCKNCRQVTIPKP